MELSNFVISGYSTRFTITLSSEIEYTVTKKVNIKIFTLKCNAVRVSDKTFSLYFRLYKRHCKNDGLYNFRCQYDDDDESSKIFPCDKGGWYYLLDVDQMPLVREKDLVTTSETSMYIEVLINRPLDKKLLSSLHDNIPFNFDLRGINGSVSFHDMVLAASSPVFMKMLTGKWQESIDSYAEVQYATKQTLENLKKMLYFGILPDTGIEQLLLITKYYMMEDMMQICIDYFLINMRPEDVPRLLIFAGQNDIVDFIIDILELLEVVREFKVADIKATMNKKNSEITPDIDNPDIDDSDIEDDE